MPKTIGIDIGNHSVKFTYRRGNKVRCVSTVLPENLIADGQMTMINSMKDFLKTTKKKLKIPSGNVSLILSGRQLYCHMVNMPYISESQLKLNLPYEFRDYVANDASLFYYDYAVEEVIKDENDKPASINILAACVSKKLIEDFFEAFSGTGFKLLYAIPVEVSYSTLLHKNAEISPEKSFCIADIGHNTTKIHFYQGTSLSATRNIDIGGRDIDYAIAEEFNTDEFIANSFKTTNYQNVIESEVCKNVYSRIGIEIMKSVNFFLFNNPDSHLDDIYFTGGSSVLEEIRNAVAETTSLNSHMLEELCTDTLEGDNVTSAIVAYGALLSSEKKK